MCEFKVYVKTAEGEREVTQDIVQVDVRNGEATLRDVLGSSKSVKNAIVSRIDVGKERLELVEVPMLAEIQAFLSQYERCLGERRYDTDLELRWDDVKAKGDEMVRSLWARYKGVKAQ
mgnify:CR=1 FL=1